MDWNCSELLNWQKPWVENYHLRGPFQNKNHEFLSGLNVIGASTLKSVIRFGLNSRSLD
jgi:hypothetical protein